MKKSKYFCLLFLAVLFSCEEDLPYGYNIDSIDKQPFKLVVSTKEIELGGAVNLSETLDVTSVNQWEFTDIPSWLTVSPQSGSGSATITITAESLKYGDDERNAVIKLRHVGHDFNIEIKVNQDLMGVFPSLSDAVDLGLSVKWAPLNVGATNPGDYGDYFAWGETSTKNSYNWSTYKYGNSSTTLTKYCTKAENGTVDNNTQLDLSDDAARANWGGSWRMPTIEELEELDSKCTWTWTSQDGHNGYRVTGPNGNSIFLPAAGQRSNTGLNLAGSFGNYWSSSLNESYPYYGRYLFFHSSNHGTTNDDRYYGYCVRPVIE